MPRTSPAKSLIDAGRRFYSRNWVLATSGNFSAVVSHRPLRLCITRSGAHKGTLTSRDFLTIDGAGKVVGRTSTRPSAEARLHLEIIRARKAGAVLHTHSVWSTMLSEHHAADRGVALQGFEMLKALDGVTTHTHREWVPIVENDQDMARLSAEVARVLAQHGDAHAFLLRGHGLYTWGRTVAEAERHVEAVEFLLEIVGRRSQM